tara:strand:+ start:110 stop:448 length:339 start_codon:yes stop_codon:yes gene_type:complete
MMGIRENIALADIVVKHGITVDQIRELASAMRYTWSSIAYDIAECFDGGEDELYGAYADEAEMIAENTLDADRVVTFCPDRDLKWVYVNDDGSHRLNVIEMGEEILRANTGW